jgi:hypothetical protein
MNRITRIIAAALIAFGFAAGVASPAHAGQSPRGGLSFIGGP